MANENALNLDKLLEGDSTFRERYKLEQGFEVNKRFADFFPKPLKDGVFFWKKLEYPKLTREQIKEILVRNHLVGEGADAETATNEALKRRYKIGEYEGSYFFVELINGNGQKAYEFRWEKYYSLENC